MNYNEILATIWPLIALQITFQIYALTDLIISKKKKTRNLNFATWVVIIVVGEIVGPAVYFAIGRSEQ